MKKRLSIFFFLSTETTSSLSPTSSLQCVPVMTPHHHHDEDHHHHEEGKKTKCNVVCWLCLTLQGFVLGKLDLLTVSPGKLKFASVIDFSLSKLPRESFIVWGLKTAREQKNVLWISLDNYPKAEKGKNQIPE